MRKVQRADILDYETYNDRRDVVRQRVLAEKAKRRIHLESAVGAYNSTVGSFEARVLVSARQFRELGVPAAKEIGELPQTDKAVRALTVGAASAED